MSHIVEIKTQVRDAAAVQAACRRLGLSPPVPSQLGRSAQPTAEGADPPQ